MKFIAKVFLVFLFLSLYHKPEFVFIPFSNNTFFGVLGFLSYILDRKTANLILQTKSINYTKILKFSYPVAIIALASIVINNTHDIYYLKLPLVLLLAFFANYFLARIAYYAYGKFDIKLFLDYFILAHFLYLGVSVMMFFNSSFMEFIQGLLKIDDVGLDAYERTAGTRIIGFGASYFASGLLNGFFLILLSVYICTFRLSDKKRVLLLLFYVITLVIGMAMARTTMIGAVIGICLLLYLSLSNIILLFKVVFYGLITLFSAILLFSFVIDYYNLDIAYLAKFAFEIVENYFTTGKASSSSMDKMWEMYNILPQDNSTWLIGDALFVDPSGFGYYKNVDIGYLRAIWYFGLLGTFFLFRYYYKSIKYLILDLNLFGKGSKVIFFALFSYVLIINLKGPCDLFYYLVALFFCNRDYKKNNTLRFNKTSLS